MKPYRLFLGMALFWPMLLPAQPYQLTDCQDRATLNSPLQAQVPLLDQMADLQTLQDKSQYLPQLGVNGQIAYLSDVITFPSLGPGLEFPVIPNTQYRVAGEVQQVIYAGGARDSKKGISEWEARLRQRQVQAALYPIEQQVNQFFFAILSLEKQVAILQRNQEVLQSRRKALQAAVDNGVRLSSDLASFDKQALQLDQQEQQLQSQARATRRVLAQLMGVAEILPGSLTLPAAQPLAEPGQALQRPELGSLQTQQQLLGQQQLALKSRLRPTVAAFATGGVGQPNPFNFLKTEVSGYYQVGLRLQWTPWDWRQTQRKGEMLGVQQDLLQTQQTQFEEGISLQLIQQTESLRRIELLISQDAELLALQQQIVQRAAAQLENGVLTATDYLSELNNQTQLELQQEQHRIQLLQAQADWKYLTGEE